MTDGRGSDERLPWLQPAARAAPEPSAAARRARTPLMLLLALLVGSGVAVMAFLVGRGTAPVEQASPISAPVVAPAAVTAPPPTPIAVQVPTRVQPVPPVSAQLAPPPAAPLPAAPAKIKRAAAPPAIKRAASRRTAEAAPPSVRVSQKVRVHRNTPGARAYRWPAQARNRPSGRVVQLGAYRTQAEVGAAWRRLYAAYPYLGRLPRRVDMAPPSAGRPRYYRLRFGTRSPRAARGLCTELHRRGRGCIVV